MCFGGEWLDLTRRGSGWRCRVEGVARCKGKPNASEVCEAVMAPSGIFPTILWVGCAGLWAML